VHRELSLKGRRITERKAGQQQPQKIGMRVVYQITQIRFATVSVNVGESPALFESRMVDK
jgi:hypothetical protein